MLLIGFAWLKYIQEDTLIFNRVILDTTHEGRQLRSAYHKGMIDPDDHPKNHYLYQIVANKACSMTSITLTTFCVTVIMLDSEQWIDMIDFLPCAVSKSTMATYNLHGHSNCKMRLSLSFKHGIDCIATSTIIVLSRLLKLLSQNCFSISTEATLCP